MALADYIKGSSGSVIHPTSDACDDDVVQTLRFTMGLAILSTVGCGGSGNTSGTGGGGGVTDMSTAVDAGPTIVGQHGVVIDYFTNAPLAGFTLTDGQNTTTSDANGNFVLPAPAGVALAPTVTGPMYSTLHLPEAMASGIDVNRGAIPIPSSSTFGLEQQVVANDQTMALIQVTLIKTGACTAIAGGTVTVNSPPGALVKYFTTQGLPTSPSFQEVDSSLNKPAAVVYNVPVGQQIDITINHPTCKVVARTSPINGMLLSGNVATEASEPNDVNASLVYVLE